MNFGENIKPSSQEKKTRKKNVLESLYHFFERGEVVALAQVKAGNNSEILLTKIRQMVYSLYQSKQINKKLYNNIIKSIQLRV